MRAQADVMKGFQLMQNKNKVRVGVPGIRFVPRNHLLVPQRILRHCPSSIQLLYNPDTDCMAIKACEGSNKSAFTYRGNGNSPMCISNIDIADLVSRHKWDTSVTFYATGTSSDDDKVWFFDLCTPDRVNTATYWRHDELKKSTEPKQLHVSFADIAGEFTNLADEMKSEG